MVITHPLQAIELSQVAEPEPGTLCVTTGWGVMEEGGMFLASNLQKVNSMLCGCIKERTKLSRECHTSRYKLR